MSIARKKLRSYPSNILVLVVRIRVGRI